MATAITLKGGSGADTINYSFVVTGINTTRLAVQFADSVNSLLTGGNPLTLLHPFGGAGAQGGDQGGTVQIYDLVPSTVDGVSNVYSVFAPGFIVDTISGGATVGSAGNDTILVAGQNSQTTVSIAGANGNNDQVIFVSGNNAFFGDTTAGAGNGDSIVAGSGFDTISTGGGSATVNSGTGEATIYLNDTTTGSTINQFVWLDDGHSVVYANGANDAVIATIGGQTINGGSSADSNLTVVLAASAGNDLVNGGAGASIVFDSSTNDTVNAGTGGLWLVTGSDIAATVNGGGGQLLVFGSAGDSITVGNEAGVTSGLTELIAGSGDEVLNGAGALSGLAFFGSADGAANDTLTGGFGNDTLVAGTGNETLTGGAGSDLFVLNMQTDANGNITIADFAGSSSDVIGFTGGYTPDDIANAIAGGQEVDGNFVITLSDNTTVTFTGVSGASDLNGHIVTF